MSSTNDTRVEETERDWVRAHAALSRLARERAAADAEEGRWLLCALRSAAHVHLGFGSFVEYIERLFGYKPRSTQAKLRVAEALEGLPHLARALDSGSLGWSAVRELTRVVVPDTEREWLEFAEGKTVRQLEELVAGKGRGDDPLAPNRPDARRHVLRFEVAPETFALVREAISWLRRRSPDSLDDDAALLSMARHVLGQHRDDGRASYQIALTVCAACGAGQQRAGGQLIPVGADIVAMAHCDGQHLGPIAPLVANENALPVVAQTDAGDSARAAADHAHAGADATASSTPRDASAAKLDATPDCAHAYVHAASDCSDDGATPDCAHAHATPDCAHAHATPDCAHATPDCAHVYARPDCTDDGATDAEAHVRAPRHDTPGPIRATQTIPPALRRAVLVRDQHCCRVPGCKNTVYLELHHIELRSEGGRHVISNILTICGSHHRATHQGTLIIERDASGGVHFYHGDGTPYGQALEPQALDAQTKVFSALRNMGFKESAVRPVLAELRRDDSLRGASIQDLLRNALRRISPQRPRAARG